MNEEDYEPLGDVGEGPFAAAGAGEGLDWAEQGQLEGPLSLDAPVGDEWGNTLGDLIADSTSDPQSDDEGTGIHELRERLIEAIDAFPELERKAMSLRFGQEDGRPRTLNEVSEELGMDPACVRQVESRLLGRLRGHHCSMRLEDRMAD